ncbi:MAG: oxygen-independent coproporphyrinogen III oxidase [Bdellovibrio sp.]
MEELIKKYDRHGPRYTSYPPVPLWSGAPSSQDWFNHIKQSLDPIRGADLYLHIPYCEKLCYYCGCHRVIKKSKNENRRFVNALIREWKLYQQMIPQLKAHSIHLGGGTPTFLLPDELSELLQALTREYPLELGSVEVDPRTTSLEHLKVFKQYGLNRLSMGVQDFDPFVQKLINRNQSFELVEKLVQAVRALEFDSLNFDLIYGLPGQTVDGLLASAELVLKLRPDMIAFYSYAHVPWKIANQKLINENLLPAPQEKHRMNTIVREFFLANGYIDIGLDHFALPDSPLGLAKKRNQLLRNFMGHTDKKSNVLIGLGPSSISNSSLSFVQNEKEINSYLEKIESGELPLASGHTHNQIDLEIDRIIQSIMCRGHWNRPKIEMPYQSEIQSELAEMEKDGLIVQMGDEFQVTETGKFFLRNISMIYDVRLREQKNSQRFSRTI